MKSASHQLNEFCEVNFTVSILVYLLDNFLNKFWAFGVFSRAESVPDILGRDDPSLVSVEHVESSLEVFILSEERVV
jgi:hypothetical protein